MSRHEDEKLIQASDNIWWFVFNLDLKQFFCIKLSLDRRTPLDSGHVILDQDLNHGNSLVFTVLKSHIVSPPYNNRHYDHSWKTYSDIPHVNNLLLSLSI